MSTPTLELGEFRTCEILPENTGIVALTLARLYSKPLDAFIRELGTNALDAQRMIGVTSPVIIVLPSEFSPWAVVKDAGPGLTLEQMQRVFTGFGGSTKRDDPTQVGHIGAGAKSPFAVAREFFVTSVATDESGNTWRTEMQFRLNDDDIPQYAIIAHEQSDGATGLTVTVPTEGFAAKDVMRAAKRVAYWWEPGEVEFRDTFDTVLEMKSFRDAIIKKWSEKHVPGVTMQRGAVGSSLVMGGIAYELPHHMWDIEQWGVAIHVPIDAVTITPDRESIEDTSENRELIRGLFESWRKKRRKACLATTADAQSTFEIVKAINKFMKDVPVYARNTDFPDANDLADKRGFTLNLIQVPRRIWRRVGGVHLNETIPVGGWPQRRIEHRLFNTSNDLDPIFVVTEDEPVTLPPAEYYSSSHRELPLDDRLRRAIPQFRKLTAPKNPEKLRDLILISKSDLEVLATLKPLRLLDIYTAEEVFDEVRTSTKRRGAPTRITSVELFPGDIPLGEVWNGIPRRASVPESLSVDDMLRRHGALRQAGFEPIVVLLPTRDIVPSKWRDEVPEHFGSLGKLVPDEFGLMVVRKTGTMTAKQLSNTLGGVDVVTRAEGVRRIQTFLLGGLSKRRRSRLSHGYAWNSVLLHHGFALNQLDESIAGSPAPGNDEKVEVPTEDQIAVHEMLAPMRRAAKDAHRFVFQTQPHELRSMWREALLNAHIATPESDEFSLTAQLLGTAHSLSWPLARAVLELDHARP